MLNGITVLAEEMVMKTPNWIFGMLFFGFFAVLISFISIIVFAGSSWEGIPIGMLSAGLIFVTLSFVFNLCFEEPDYMSYDVIIDNEVSMKEFHDNYEIVSVKGKIYTIKERENKK